MTNPAHQLRLFLRLGICYHLVIYEPEAKIVRFIFEWYTLECWSAAQICNQLNNMGIPTPAAADLYDNIAPFRERFEMVELLLSENRKHMEKLLDLYLNSDFPKEMLTERKETLERTIKSLENEQRTLLNYIEGQILKTETVDEVLKLQAKIAQRLSDAEDFATRREVVELLDLRVRLCVEADMGVAYVTCILGTKCLGISSSQFD